MVTRASSKPGASKHFEPGLFIIQNVNIYFYQFNKNLVEASRAILIAVNNFICF